MYDDATRDTSWLQLQLSDASAGAGGWATACPRGARQRKFSIPNNGVWTRLQCACVRGAGVRCSNARQVPGLQNGRRGYVCCVVSVRERQQIGDVKREVGQCNSASYGATMTSADDNTVRY
ncbi:hypothetical protein ACJJTC_015813 [Scirpophaga incertulas]